MKYLIIILLILFIGCANDSQIQIVSDTQWTGTIGKVEISGTGNAYLELPENSPKTELVNCFNQKEIITPDTREGNILIFPSFVIHRAPILKTECRKTIISFNIDFENISIDVLNNLI